MSSPPETSEKERANRVLPFAVTHGVLLRLAVPMTLAGLSVPLVGIIDTAVIGQLGDAALLGGIAVGTIILDVVFASFNFLRSGTTGLTAQAYGAEDRREMTAVLVRALLVAVGIGLLTIALRWPLIEFGMLLIGASDAVAGAARSYLAIRIWSSPFILANFVLLGWLLGRSRSATVLLIQIVYSALHIGLSLWLVLGQQRGVAGVAWASVAAEAATTLIQLPVAASLIGAEDRPSLARVVDRAGFVRLVALNRDILIRSFALLFSFAYFAREGARLGEVVLAGNAVLMHFYTVSGYFLDGFANAGEQLAGRALGARFRPAFHRVVRLATGWSFVLALALAALLLVAGPWFIAAMTTSPDVRAVASRYLVWAAASPLFGVLAWQMDGIFIGATWSRDMRNMMVLSTAIYLLACKVLVPPFGNDGLWAALIVFVVARGITLTWRMRRMIPVSFPVSLG